MNSKKFKVSRNAWELAEDLGLPPSAAIEWETRHLIAEKIIETVKYSNISITKLAKESGTSRARITRVLKMDTIGISIDVLLRILGACGQKFKFSLRKVS